jgi:hypothetical protein
MHTKRERDIRQTDKQGHQMSTIQSKVINVAKDSNEGSTFQDVFCDDDIYLEDAGTDKILFS